MDSLQSFIRLAFAAAGLVFWKSTDGVLAGPTIAWRLVAIARISTRPLSIPYDPNHLIMTRAPEELDCSEPWDGGTELVRGADGCRL